MSLLPSLIYINLKGTRNFSLWLPLFLLWPLFIILLPFFFLFSFILFKGNLKKASLFIPYSYNLLADFRGTHIDIKEAQQQIYISIK